VDEETRDAIALITVRHLVVREMVARLLAYEALRHDDPEGLLRHFSEGVEHSIYRAEEGTEVGPKTMKAQKAAQDESDWMVAAARKMINRAGEG
jgi:hypothetical protein